MPSGVTYRNMIALALVYLLSTLIADEIFDSLYYYIYLYIYIYISIYLSIYIYIYIYDSSVYYFSVLQDSQPLRGHEKKQREVFYFEI